VGHVGWLWTRSAASCRRVDSPTHPRTASPVVAERSAPPSLLSLPPAALPFVPEARMRGWLCAPPYPRADPRPASARCSAAHRCEGCARLRSRPPSPHALRTSRSKHTGGGGAGKWRALCCVCVSSAISSSTQCSAGLKVPMDDPSWTRTTSRILGMSPVPLESCRLTIRPRFRRGLSSHLARWSVTHIVQRGWVDDQEDRCVSYPLAIGTDTDAWHSGGLYSSHTIGLERCCGFHAQYAVPSKSSSSLRIFEG
jgi:hypothetical protein